MSSSRRIMRGEGGRAFPTSNGKKGANGQTERKGEGYENSIGWEEREPGRSEVRSLLAETAIRDWHPSREMAGSGDEILGPPRRVRMYSRDGCRRGAGAGVPLP